MDTKTETGTAEVRKSYTKGLRTALSILLVGTIVIAALLADTVARLATGSLIDRTLAGSAHQVATTAGQWRNDVKRQLNLVAHLTQSFQNRPAEELHSFISSVTSFGDDMSLIVTDGNGQILSDRTNAYGVGNDLPGVLAEQIFRGRWRFASPLNGDGQPWGYVVLELPVAQLTTQMLERSGMSFGILGPDGLVLEGTDLPPGISLGGLPLNELQNHKAMDGTWVLYRAEISDDGWHVVQLAPRSATYRSIMWIHIATSLGAIVALAGVFLFLPTMLSRLDKAIQSIGEAIKALTQGDFSKTMNEQGDDDVVTFARLINKLSGVLESALGEVEYSAQLVSASSEEILTSAEAQEETANRQSSSLNETAATAEEMNLSAQQAATNAESVVTKTEEASQQILALSEKAQQISQVTEFIDEISHQIRILALNASIESAKAGGKGGGFAVIASEIRQLADDARQSTGEIETLVQDMQEATSTSVMTMEQTVESVKVIGLAMNEQSVATGHVTEAMTSMSTTMTQTVENTRTTVSSGEELYRLAFELQQAINRVSGREVETFEQHMGQAMGGQGDYYDYQNQPYGDALPQDELNGDWQAGPNE